MLAAIDERWTEVIAVGHGDEHVGAVVEAGGARLRTLIGHCGSVSEAEAT